MTAADPPDLAAELAAALEWWREAGVDRSFRDEAEGWLAEPSTAKPDAPGEPAPAQAPPPAEAPPAPRIGGERSGWPTALDAFTPWWLGEPSLAEPGGLPRVPPRGDQGPELMVLVPEPEESDRDTLLSGENGTLLAAMLAAMAIEPGRAYFASAIPRHTPLVDWERLETGGLGEVTGHHMALVAPRRVLVFGRLALPQLEHGMAQGAARELFFNHEGRRVPVLHTWSLDRMRQSAQARAGFWRHWLDWTDRTG